MSEDQEHSKQYSSLSEMLKAAQEMSKFQKIHNVLRKDYIELLRITENHDSSEESFNALYRASVRSFFSLIETDVFSLNQLDEYEGYQDKAAFKKKFKETFKQIGQTWNKKEIVSKYFDSKLQLLLEFRDMRDELIHPKAIEHIHSATDANFSKLKKVFLDYDNFINDLMNNFYVSASIKN